MFSYKFISRHDRHNTVFLRIICNRKKAELAMRIKMSQSDLDDVLSLSPSRTNRKWAPVFAQFRAVIENIQIELFHNNENKPDVANVRDRIAAVIFDREIDRDKKLLITHRFTQHIASISASRTRYTFLSVLTHIRNFDSKADKLTFDTMDIHWLTEFDHYLQTQNLAKNTRNLYLAKIKAIFNIAIDEGITTSYPFRKIKLRNTETRKRALDVENLRRVLNASVTPTQQKYLDFFRLQFLLIGINIVDLALNIRIEQGRVEYYRAKTSKLYSIKLQPEAKEIIDRYRNPSGIPLLNFFSSIDKANSFATLINNTLKEIAKQLGIPPITTYWARHSWATIAADLDIPDAVISCALGHGPALPVTEIYIRRNQKKVDEANRRVIDYVLYGK